MIITDSQEWMIAQALRVAAVGATDAHVHSDNFRLKVQFLEQAHKANALADQIEAEGLANDA